MIMWELLDDAEPMSLDEFWSRIEESREISRGEGTMHHDALASILSLEEVEAIASFQKRFQMLSKDANRKDIHRVLGGSDDGFHYNITHVISMGREAYESLLAKPRSFSQMASGYELFEYAGYQAIEEPHRSELRNKALARKEAEQLDEELAHPNASRAAPRV